MKLTTGEDKHLLATRIGHRRQVIPMFND